MTWRGEDPEAWKGEDSPEEKIRRQIRDIYERVDAWVVEMYGSKESFKRLMDHMDERERRHTLLRFLGHSTEECWLDDWNLENGFDSPFV